MRYGVQVSQSIACVDPPGDRLTNRSEVMGTHDANSCANPFFLDAARICSVTT
jgi:hypothetical protein